MRKSILPATYLGIVPIVEILAAELRNGWRTLLVIVTLVAYTIGFLRRRRARAKELKVAAQGLQSCFARLELEYRATVATVPRVAAQSRNEDLLRLSAAVGRKAVEISSESNMMWTGPRK